VDSITTSANTEDYVSMGMTAALKLRQILSNTRSVLAIEAVAAAQALDFLAPLKTSARSQAACTAIRAASPAIHEDRSLAGDFERVALTIAEGKVAAALD
ncbi:MAG: aromatic amino acid lyase, partial [Terriglobales bacterium]